MQTMKGICKRWKYLMDHYGESIDMYGCSYEQKNLEEHTLLLYLYIFI